VPNTRDKSNFLIFPRNSEENSFPDKGRITAKNKSTCY